MNTESSTPETKPIPCYYQDANDLRISANQASSVLSMLSQKFETDNYDETDKEEIIWILHLVIDLMGKIETKSYSLDDAAHRVTIGQIT